MPQDEIYRNKRNEGTVLFINMQTSQQTTQKKKYQTRIVSTANKVNLKLEDAINPLTQGLAKSVAGIF